MPTRTTRKGVTAAKRAPKKPSGKRSSKPQVTAPPDPSLPLENERHERFACEWIKDFNGTQAYLRTYPDVTQASAEASSARLFGNASVRARGEFLAREALGGDKVEGQKVVRAVATVAFQDIRKAFDERGNLLPIHDLPDEVAGAIAGIEIFEEYEGKGADRVFTGYTKKIKFTDRIGACSLLGKHFKLFTEKVEVAGPNGGAIPVQSQESPEQRAALSAVSKRLSALESRVQK